LPLRLAHSIAVPVVFFKVRLLNAHGTKLRLTELVVGRTEVVTWLPFSLAGSVGAGPVISFVGSLHYAPGATLFIPVLTNSVARGAFALADLATLRVVFVKVSTKDASCAAFFVSAAANSIALLPLALTAVATGPHPVAPGLGDAVLATLDPVVGAGPVAVDLQPLLLEQAGAVAVREPLQTTPIRRLAAFL